MKFPTNLKDAKKEYKKRVKSDARQRQAAAHRIINASDVQEGKYDIERLLRTTLGLKPGEEHRVLTHDDLAAFRHNANQVRNRYTAGIRARQVLDLSLRADRDRANAQIKTAIPVAAKGGVVRFMTDAGPDYGAKHHHVVVNFLTYSSAATGSMGDAKASAMRMKREPLKIECDCGRWRFWYRYVATIGKYNAGRDETGYPRIRNPELRGVACKHILRVMQAVESSPPVLTFLERLIRKARDADNNSIKLKTKQAEADLLAAQDQGQIRDADTAWQRTKRRARERAEILKAVLASGLPGRAAPASASAANNPGKVAKQFGITMDKLKSLFGKKP